MRRSTTGTGGTGGTGATVVAMAAPITVRVWGPGGALDDVDAPRAPRLTAPGVVAADGKSADIALTAEQVASLGVGYWEWALTVTDPRTMEPDTLTRGWFRVAGSVDEL